jgi:hypothetical protein
LLQRIARTFCQRSRPSAPTKDPQKRWVDGTPEYSFYICDLRKLSPQASFIHLFVNRRQSCIPFCTLVGWLDEHRQNERQAYDYWLRTIRDAHKRNVPTDRK